MVRLALGLVLLAACRDVAEPAAPAPPAASSAAPVVSSPPAAPVATAAATPGRSCLPTVICSCNLGCTAIDVAEGDLREGLQTTAATGRLKGQKVQIRHATDATGAEIWAVSDRAANMPCMTPADRASYAYLCASDRSGPIPPNACRHGCE